MGRDGFSGRIDLNGFMRILDLYSEVHRLDCWDKMEMLDKLLIVSRVEDEKREHDKPLRSAQHPAASGKPCLGRKR